MSDSTVHHFRTIGTFNCQSRGKKQEAYNLRWQNS
uniref:Uncharacterized protein n=1 Tax=Rhizophora mucronata TaxID=61149 RepID=A0A2P2JFL3_RHIMU